jgi:hypothetical protein
MFIASSSNTDGESANSKPVTYESIQHIEPSTPSNQTYMDQKRVGLKAITFLLAIVFLPLIGFSIVILWLIFHYRLILDDTPSSLNLQAGRIEQDDAYYYVKLSATRILFIASWSSTIAPVLVGVIVSDFEKTFQDLLVQSFRKTTNTLPSMQSGPCFSSFTDRRSSLPYSSVCPTATNCHGSTT